MEATVVSLTRTVLDGVLGIAGTALAHDAALLLGVPREVEFIRCELQMMQSFLRDQSSDACSAGGYTVTTCVKQVRDLACDLEDCLLDLTMDEPSRPTWLQWGPSLAARLRVADRIRDLKASLVELNQRQKRYNVFFDNDQQKTTQEHRHTDDEYHFTPWDEQQDIQRNDEMNKLAALVNTREGGSVVSVWGMGGMGKSSLVRMLYNDSDLIAGFDGRAWVTLPHPLESTDDVERRLRKQLGLKSTDLGVPAWLEKKRCLVVVDDVSSHKEWELLSRCLGVGVANGTGTRSRVVVTTRREDIAQRCASGDGGVYELEFRGGSKGGRAGARPPLSLGHPQ